MMSNFEDWENIIHFGILFGSFGKKNILYGFGNDSRKGSLFYSGKKSLRAVIKVDKII